jgi:hypothetical protein
MTTSHIWIQSSGMWRCATSLTARSFKDKGIMILQSVSNYSANHKVSHPRWHKTSNYVTVKTSTLTYLYASYNERKENFSFVRIISFSFQTTPNKSHILVSTEFIPQLQPAFFVYFQNAKQDLNNKYNIPNTVMENSMCHSNKWWKPNLSYIITNIKRDVEGKTDK